MLQDKFCFYCVDCSAICQFIILLLAEDQQKVSPDQGDLEVAPLQVQGCIGAGRAVAVGQREEAGHYCEILCCVPGFMEIKN